MTFSFKWSYLNFEIAQTLDTHVKMNVKREGIFVRD